VVAGALLGGQSGQVRMHVEAAGRCGPLDGRRDAVVDEPAEDVAHAALAGLVAEQPGDDPTVDDAAHPGDVLEGLAVHDVARRGAHDGQHLAGIHGPRSRGRHVRVDVADGDGDARRQPGPGSSLLGQPAGARAEGRQRAAQLLFHEAREALVQRGEELRRRVAAVLVDRLVAGGAGVAGEHAAQLPDDPVRGFDPQIDAVVGVRVLVEDLERLRELPLGRDAPAVARQPGLAHLGGERVYAVSLATGRVVLPELGVRVRAAREVRVPAQRRAVGEHRHRRGSREVRGDPDHGGGIDARGGDGLRHRGGERLDVVLRILERPLRRELLARDG
jgi:hypothetical protein